jgi:hypothetical protein
MKIGIGFCNNKDAFESGKTVVKHALQDGRIEKPSLVLAFCGGQLDHQLFFEGMRSVLPQEVPVIGGSSIGIITNHYLSYKNYPAAAAVLQTDKIRTRVVCSGKLDEDEKSAGEKLAGELSAAAEGKLLLIFYDSLKVPATDTTPPSMNASPLLLSGIEQEMQSQIPIIGAGVVGDFGLKTAAVFCGDAVKKQHVVGALLGGKFQVYSTIMHGCTLKDGIYHTITKIEGPVIYELDNKPIVEIINEMYGNEEWQKQVPVGRLTIGVNYGEKFGEFKEDQYVNRLITGVLPNKEGIILFEPDLEAGTEIQFMLRDSDIILHSAEKNAARLLKQITEAGKTPYFGMYIDCAGRAAEFSNTETEEAEQVTRTFNQYKIPVFGFYSGVEVAPLLGKARGLDWTGVLMVITSE